MKLILLISLFLFTFCETESSNVVDFYKCLLLDSDTVYNHINSLVEAVKTLDPIKLAESFTTIYPAIALEVTRCQLQVRKLDSPKNENGDNTIIEFLKNIVKMITDYLIPNLSKFRIELKTICKNVLSNSFLCELL